MPTRILCIVGTRPEAIKMAPVIQALSADPDFTCLTCATGQHRQMLDQALELFSIRPQIDLDLMRPNQTLTALTAELLTRLAQVLAETRPDWVLAQGDTTSVMAAATAAFYHGIRFGHVEAGLRTGDLQRPFPEEFNRRIADLVAHAAFAPTALAREQLLREGAPAHRVHLTGNTVVDALHRIAQLPFRWRESPVAQVPEDRPIVLVTAHRRESFGAPLRCVCDAVRELAARFADTSFVFPVHLNPAVQETVRSALANRPNIFLFDPLDYRTLVQVMKRAALVLTDSGGIQEEAPTFGVPVLVLRDTTERPEGVSAGVAALVGTDPKRILAAATDLLGRPARQSARPNPYGDGHAAQRIVDVLRGQVR